MKHNHIRSDWMTESLSPMAYMMVLGQSQGTDLPLLPAVIVDAKEDSLIALIDLAHIVMVSKLLW